MSSERPITIPPIGELRAELKTKQAEVRRLRNLLLLAKAVCPSEADAATGRTEPSTEARP